MKTWEAQFNVLLKVQVEKTSVLMRFFTKITCGHCKFSTYEKSSGQPQSLARIGLQRYANSLHLVLIYFSVITGYCLLKN